MFFVEVLATCNSFKQSDETENSQEAYRLHVETTGLFYAS